MPSLSPLNSSMTTTGLWLLPTRRSSGFTILPKKGGRRFRLPPDECNRRSELVLEANLELALVVVDLAIRVHERRRIAGTGAPCGVLAVEPVEDVEGCEIDRRLVTPRHLEGLGDTHVEPLVGDVFLRKEFAAHIAEAACAYRLVGEAEDDIAERRAGR